MTNIISTYNLLTKTIYMIPLHLSGGHSTINLKRKRRGNVFQIALISTRIVWAD